MQKWRWMKEERLFVIFFLFTIFWSSVCFARDSEKNLIPFAVVELFTSEGCSSCPPADKLLAEIAREARQTNKRVFPIAFHVDYWNNLGWKDPFSHSDFSLRQRRYARVLGVQVYTPQMIINGKEAFVGGDRASAFQSIESALSKPAQVNLALKVDKPNHPDSLLVKYEVSKMPKGQILHIALVERGLVNKILEGENAGRTLEHDNVVRLFKTISLEKNGSKGSIDLKYNSGIYPEKMSIIAYVQDSKKMIILGAASCEF
jgi:hypothetical protein